MKTDKTSRRRLLAGMAGFLGASTFASKTAAAVLTPSASEGPFYPLPSMRTPDIDNDLVKITGLVQGAGGEVFTLRGTITNRDGHPRVGHRIEIWQCDLDGNYQHPNDPRSANFDPAFQGFGHDITDQNGAYVFRTIKPEVYPGRTPHIHVKIFDGASELLTTQIYVKGDPGNPHDSLFKRMSKAHADAVSMVFVKGETGPEATINIII